MSDESVAYIGDDLIDLPILRKAGFAVAVANACPEVKECAHYITQKNGGEGAVREVSDMILKAQGKFAESLEKFTGIKL